MYFFPGHRKTPGDSFSLEPLQRPELQILLEEAAEEMEEEIAVRHEFVEGYKLYCLIMMNHH